MHQTLVSRLWQPADSRLRQAIIVITGSLLIWASAKIQVPFYPVPMTMQTLVILGLGFALGPRLGLATLMLYMAQGAMGLPVFAGSPEKGIGLAYMAGPTGGYLLGFALAIFACGHLAELGWDRSVIKTALAMIIGNGLIYLPGILWLGTMIGWDQPVLEWGLYPFLLGDGLKIILAMTILPFAWRMLNRSK